ncbi:hypothetical protein HHL28_03240 [Aerophototrophica crusticola]|uniref:Putative auto-transporter adhesin head GIN domain-containing protein n=1 Tax=Aerophototrophica crusticola TaxID=1709002 RepID=A0A858R4C4_9PROT|nr:hypothetical protein HHL28_03240 [Rhodospirillaceae bacterium B3]
MRALPAFTLFLALAGTPALAAPQSFTADSVRVTDIVGTVQVVVDPAARAVTADVTGQQRWVDTVRLEQSGDTLSIIQDRSSQRGRIGKDDMVTVSVTLPPGTALELGNLVGDARVGDLDGTLRLRGSGAADVKVGRVAGVDLDLSGAGDVTLGEVRGPLRGSLSGAGSVEAGPVRGELSLDVSGFGDVDVDAVHGPVKVRLSGVGDVHIKGGHTPLLDANASGVGSIRFDGSADDYRVDHSGIGSVRINGKKAGRS